MLGGLRVGFRAATAPDVDNAARAEELAGKELKLTRRADLYEQPFSALPRATRGIGASWRSAITNSSRPPAAHAGTPLVRQAMSG